MYTTVEKLGVRKILFFEKKWILLMLYYTQLLNGIVKKTFTVYEKNIKYDIITTKLNCFQILLLQLSSYI